MSEYYKGTYQVVNPQKYIGKHAPIFRSSWEKRAFYWADHNTRVIRWGSECVVIQYLLRRDMRIHRYITDMYVEVLDNENQIRKFIVEIKPKKKLLMPKPPKRQTAKSIARYVSQKDEYEMNQDKWKAARKFCEQNKIEFKILTEDDIL